MLTEVLTPTAILTNGYQDDSLFLENDPFPYGWRNIKHIAPDGTEEWSKIPLTPEDFFNPQLGDYMPQDQRHAKLGINIHDKLEKHLPSMTVLFDTKILWGIRGLREPFSDVTVIPTVVELKTASFSCKKHKVRPCLIVEIMSPQYAGDDTTKVEIYEQAGVTEYFIINPHFMKEEKPLEIIAYRLVGQKYQPIPQDEAGRWWSETTQVWFTHDTTQRQLVLLDGTTGQPLLTNLEEQSARHAAEAQAHIAEAQIHIAESRAQTAEVRAQAEAQARVQAEMELVQLRAELARLRGQ